MRNFLKVESETKISGIPHCFFHADRSRIADLVIDFLPPVSASQTRQSYSEKESVGMLPGKFSELLPIVKLDSTSCRLCTDQRHSRG